MVAQIDKKVATKTVSYIQEPFLLGSMPAFARDRLSLLMQLAAKGDAAGLHFGPFPAIQFNKPEHIHSILVEHAYDFDKGPVIHNTFRPVIGDGIFSSEGAFHRRQRKLMSPPFQPRHIASYADVMTHYAELIQQEWQEGAVIDLNQDMTHLTMSIIGKVLFDADVFTEADDLGAAMATTLRYASKRFAELLPPPYSWPLPSHRRTRQAVALLEERIQQMIEDRRARGDIAERNDLLSILLQAKDEDGKPMSDKQVMAECLTLFGAGHETTATALTWAWYLLDQNPAVYQKLQQEVSVLEGRTPTYADLARLPYCLQIFKETVRLYPPAYAMSRVALRDVEIDGYHLRKGGTALLAPYAMHRNTRYFAQPEQFEPERFTPEREKLLPRYAYLPFGAGPRICIGNHFALMEGQLLLATLAQRVAFKLVPGQHIQPDPEHNVALRPGGNVNAVVHRL